MSVDYDGNLKKLLVYFQHIYYKKSDVPIDTDIFAVLYRQYTDVSTYKLINIFSINYENTNLSYLAINISLDELDVIIEQLKRNEKLKQVIEIINE